MSRIIYVVVLSLFVVACNTNKTSNETLYCESPLPYEGKALYQNKVTFPSDGYTLGGVFDQTTQNKLNAAMLDAIHLTQANVMTAAVANVDGIWQATKSADYSSQENILFWASVGKVFTATVIMQLVEEEKISLADPISNWFAQIPNASIITIDDLLKHTAGLFSANEDLLVRENPRYYSPDESIQISISQGMMFCPQQWWRYSNTGYTVLGKIIEKTDGRPYHESVNARINNRLMLSSLRSLAPFEQTNNVAPLIPSDGSKATMSPSWGYAAGNVVGTAGDMIQFWHALLTAKLLTKENTLSLFETLYPMFDDYTFYGRGVMLYSLPDSPLDNKVWLGHSGGVPGAKAVIAYSAKEKSFVAVALTGDGSAPATAQLLLKQLSAQE